MKHNVNKPGRTNNRSACCQLESVEVWEYPTSAGGVNALFCAIRRKKQNPIWEFLDELKLSLLVLYVIPFHHIFAASGVKSGGPTDKLAIGHHCVDMSMCLHSVDRILHTAYLRICVYTQEACLTTVYSVCMTTICILYAEHGQIWRGPCIDTSVSHDKKWRESANKHVEKARMGN